MNIKNERIKNKLIELYSIETPSDNELSISLAKLALQMKSDISIENVNNKIVDGWGDLGIDAIYVDDKQKKLFLVQSKWKNDGTGGIHEEGMLKMVNGIKKILNLDFSDANQKIKSMQNIIEEAMKDINYQISCVFIHNGTVKANSYVLKPMKELINIVNDLSNELILFDEFNSENIYEFLLNDLYEGEIDVNELTIYSYGKNESPYLTYYGMVNANELAEIYSKIGNRLFDNNIRYYKGNTGVNNGMENVIKDCPDKFLYYNNGIKILCKNIIKSKEYSANCSVGKFKLESANIVNGAQTTGTIGKLFKEYYENLEKTKVFIQIIQIDDEDEEKYKITKFTNTQNRIDTRDFIAQDPVQEKIKNELAFDKIFYSYKSGEQVVLDDNTISYDEAIVALACYQNDIGVATLSKSNVGKLSEDINRTPYKIMFNSSTDSALMYDCIMIYRRVEKYLKQYNNTNNRKRLISIHGNRFILYYILHIIKIAIEKGEYKNIREARNKLNIESKISECIDKIEEAISKSFNDSYPANIFKNVTKCKIIYEDIEL